MPLHRYRTRENVRLANRRDAYDQTPLLRAVKQNNYALVKSLIESGADVNRADPQGWTPLHYAIELYTPLAYASEEYSFTPYDGEDDSVDFDTSITSEQEILEYKENNCSEQSHRSLIAYLIASDANLEALNSYDQNAARLAVKNNNYLGVLAYLICRGGRIGGVDDEGNGIICDIRPKDIAVVRWLAGIPFSDPIRHEIASCFVWYPDDFPAVSWQFGVWGIVRAFLSESAVGLVVFNVGVRD